MGKKEIYKKIAKDCKILHVQWNASIKFCIYPYNEIGLLRINEQFHMYWFPKHIVKWKKSSYKKPSRKCLHLAEEEGVIHLYYVYINGMVVVTPDYQSMI